MNDDIYENYDPVNELYCQSAGPSRPALLNHNQYHLDPTASRNVEGPTSNNYENQSFCSDTEWEGNEMVSTVKDIGGSSKQRDISSKNKDAKSTNVALNRLTGVAAALVILTLISTALSVWCVTITYQAGLQSTKASAAMEMDQQGTRLHQMANSSFDSDATLQGFQHLSLTVTRMMQDLNRYQLEDRATLQSVVQTLKNYTSSRLKNDERHYKSVMNSMTTLMRSRPDIRLASGPNASSGRVEVYHQGQWGTICDDSWDIKDAAVVCRMLGYSDVINSHQSAHFGAGTGKIWLDEVECKGTEETILECPKRPWGIENCSHSEDASVVCKI